MLTHTRKLTVPVAGNIVAALIIAVLLSVFSMAPRSAAAQTLQPAGPNSSVPVHFIQTATSSNSFGDSTFINSTATNNKPNALLYITQNWNPGGIGGTYNNHSVGVWYDTGNGEWAIFQEDGSNMTIGASFNVLVIPSASSTDFVLTATTSNASGDSVYINNINTNGKPKALLTVTQSWDPGGSGGTFNNHNVGVWYDSFMGEWAVFQEDGSNMTIGASFNVLVGTQKSGGAKAFVQKATSTNTFGDFTLINNLVTNNNTFAIVFATPNWDPNGIGGTFDNASTGVWYDSSPNEWSVFNEDSSNMPRHAAFNILAFSS